MEMQSPFTGPVGRANLKDVAADRIRQLIFSGALRPNAKIDQDALAASLGISRLPIREALIGLESEGLVANIPRRGAFVAPLSPNDIRDHYRLIALASGLAARHAVEAVTDSQLDEIESILDVIDTEKDPQKQEDLNFAFHRSINVVAGSRRLRAVLHLLNSTMPKTFYSFASGWADRANKEHREIVAALRQRDADLADRLVVAHMSHGGEYSVDALTEAGFWSAEVGDKKAPDRAEAQR